MEDISRRGGYKKWGKYKLQSLNLIIGVTLPLPNGIFNMICIKRKD